MKKITVTVFLSIFTIAAMVCSFSVPAFAEGDILSSLGGKKTPSKKDQEAREALRKKIVEKKAELNGSSWSVKIDSQAKKGEMIGNDTLVFQNEKFRSERAGKMDYPSTNYTLTVQDEGPTIWETMQTSKDGEVTFWRGEWKDEVMSGIISRQLKEGSEEYYFTSAGRKEIPKTTEEKDETKINPVQETKAAAPSVLGGATVQAQKAAPAPAKKKSWFL